MKRRKFLKRFAQGIVALGIPTGLYAWQIEPFWLEFVHQKMPIKNLPKALEGKTMMQISDLHVGDRFNYHYLIDSLQKAQTFQPNIVVYTGDFVNYEGEKQLAQLAEVMPSFVKGTIGTVGVLGNHDYGANWSDQEVANKVTQQLVEAGIQILSNQSIQLEGLNIMGIDDYWGLNFEPKKALDNYQAEQANLVLCHNPDVCDLDIWGNFQGWILSGHTHGGQCKPPFLKAPILPVKNIDYDQGIKDLGDGRMLYINRALGHLRQIRFNVRPEITIFELEKA